MINPKIIFLVSLFVLCNTSGFAQPHPKSPLAKSYPGYLESKQTTTYNLEWIHLGPTMNSALVETLQVDPERPGTMYVGFGSGNLWKTTNNGLTWKPIFENQASYGIGHLAMSPSNTEILYLGTGETLKKPRNFTMPGTGVYKSNDGGVSWTHLGLDDSWHIGEIAVHPTNPEIVYVAVLGHFWSTNVNRGVYRSLNGGKDWEHVLYVDEKTGANAVVISASDPNVIYAAMWQNFPGVSGKTSGIYKSTDAGKTWKKSDAGLPENEGKGRIGLAVSNTNPNKVYALLDHRDKEQTDTENKEGLGAAEVFLTIDGGLSWKRTHDDELMIFAGLGWYFTDIYIDPKNDNEIYALGIRLAHSKDGGKIFELIGGDVFHLFPNPADPLHLDQCEMWINPDNPKHLVLGNDGGLYVSYDRGKTWLHLNNIPTGEFYDITLDNKTPYTIYGGTQDNSTVYGTAREWNPKFYDKWKYLWIDPWSGGDGCITVIDPVDTNTVFFSSQEGGVMRMDIQTGKSKGIRPKIDTLDGKLQYNFISPYILSPHDHSTLYLAGNYVLKSLDQGDTWEAVSNDLSKGGKVSKDSYAAGSFAESVLTKGRLYMGMDRGLFWTSTNGGETWIDNSDGLPDMYIRTIVPSKFKEGRIYIAMSGMNYDDFGTYLYKSEDYGNTWVSISSNLPGEVAYVIKEDPSYENILYAGLYRATYISLDRGGHWWLLGKNMPAAAVSDLEIDIRSGDLVASTHGRGIYRLNLNPIYERVISGVDEDQFFKLETAVLPHENNKQNGVDYRTLRKLPISFWVSETQMVTISILDEKEEVIWTKSLDATSGYNQYRWDLIIKRVDSPHPYFFKYNQFIEEGTYKMQVRTSGSNLIQDFEVVR